MPGFANARKRGRMAARIAAEVVIKIGVCVEMEDRHRPETGRRSLDKRKGHRMVAAERERHFAVFLQHRHMAPDRRVVAHAIFAERKVAIVGEGDIDADFGTELAGEITAVAVQRGTDRGRTACGAAFETAVDVGGQAEKADRGHALLVAAVKGRARRNGSQRQDSSRKSGNSTAGGPTCRRGTYADAQQLQGHCRARRRRPAGPQERETGRMAIGRDQPSSSPSSSGPAIISSATASVRVRIAPSRRCISSGFSVRKVFAFSRPCPMRIES